jgi:hypothetical protein
MKLLYKIINLFKKDKLNCIDRCKKTFRKMGFKKIDESSFEKSNSNGRTILILKENGLFIKVYAHGYGESDFLPNPLDDQERVINFINENQL